MVEQVYRDAEAIAVWIKENLGIKLEPWQRRYLEHGSMSIYPQSRGKTQLAEAVSAYHNREVKRAGYTPNITMIDERI